MSGPPNLPMGGAPGARRSSIMETVASTDTFLRNAGREFLVVLYTALRSLKLYPLENAQVQKALDDLAASAKHLVDVEQELELRVQGEFIFVNSTRLRLDLENYASFSHVLAVVRQCGIGTLRLEEGVDRRQLQILVSLLLSFSTREPSPSKIYELAGKLTEAGASGVFVEPPIESEEVLADAERAKEAAKRTYARSVAVTREVINSLRMGRTANVKRVKRAVQSIVDQVLNNESSLMGLTTLRDYDEYTFTHSVNVCIFSVALGRKLGLTKLQLYDLGIAALFHDVGKSRVPLEVLNKEGGLTEEEWRILQAHPWLGVLTLFGLRGYGEIPYRGMVVAEEHHMKTDLTGYPKSIRPRALSIYSKIVAVADGFDAATSRRVYQTVPIQPDQVLKEMWENPRRGYDPVVVKAFINLIGVYPVGTCVILDTYEVGIVHAANSDVSEVHRPIVRIAATADGAIQYPGVLVDLAQRDESGNYPRTIIKVTDPEKFGINVSDYFV
jgi:HD-GYP domain-containing protein (c-di-GMP phosphodiesterase class II)